MPALIRDGAAVEIRSGDTFVDAENWRRPANWLAGATAAEIKAAGVRDIVEPPPAPAGKVHVPGALRVEGDKVVRGYAVEDAPPEPVPDKVTNYQGRAVMRNLPMPDGRSLFTTVDAALRQAVEATRGKPEFDPDRLTADLNWQAWEQANDYFRHGAVTGMLAAGFGFSAAQVDDLFRQAATIDA